MSQLFKYVGLTFNRKDIFSIQASPPHDPCSFRTLEQPTWSARVSQNGAPLGMKPLPIAPSFKEGFYDYTDAPIVDPIEVTLADRVIRTKTKFKDFQKAKASGNIILNPMTRYTVKAQLQQGGRRHDPLVGVYSPMISSDLAANSVQVHDKDCWSGNYVFEIKGLKHPFDEPFLRNGPHFAMSPTVNYRVFTIDSLEPAPASVAYDAWAQVKHHLDTLKEDRGLVTSAMASANAGAMDLLTELAEARQTVSYVYGFLRSIVELITKTQRMIRQAKRRPDLTIEGLATEISSIWLQFRYAVMPMVYTVEDTLKVIESEFRPFQTFRDGQTFTFTPILEDGWVCSDLKFVDRVYLKHRYAADTSLHNMKFNPIATAWELYPLSFVVDWVLNIGDLLTSLMIPSNVSTLGAQYSRQVKDQTLVISNPGTAQGNILLNVRFYEAHPFDPLSRVGLSFDPSMSWKRWADATALSWQFTKDLLKSK